MERKLNLVPLIFMAGVILIMTSCSKEESREKFPISAIIFHSIADKQVAFTALTHSAVSWNWDFGDGQTSAEKDPVHVYGDGGYYIVVLTATDSNGNTAVAEIDVAVDLTPYVMLTGGPTATNGKTWKLTANHPVTDKLANADAALSAIVAPLPQGAFNLYLNMPEVYDKEFTFFFDGSYSMDLKDDNAAFSGLVYQMVTTGGAGIVNAGGSGFGLCTGLHEPADDASFMYVEEEGFDVPSVYGPGGVLVFNRVSTLDFSGNEFVGFKDFQSKVIVNHIGENSMQLVMFMAASPDHLPLNTHALVLTFSVVRN